MQKVVKLALICKQEDKTGKQVDYKDICKILWNLQRQTREIKNKTIQYCWEYENFSSDYRKEFGEYPKTKEILKYSMIQNYVYNKLKQDSDLFSSNLSTTTKDTCNDFKNAKKDILKGEKSIISYKSNQPLDIHNKSISLFAENSKTYVKINLFNMKKRDELNFSDTTIMFEVLAKDNSTKTILNRCINKEYKITASKLIYNKKKKTWVLNLGYNFESQPSQLLDENKILGVDLGIHYPICASVFGSLDRFIIKGGEIENFRKQVCSRRNSLLEQGKFCGDGRIGHGINTRIKPAYNVGNKISNFRDTANHKYSRALIEYAKKNNCGIIQMEDLKGITDKEEKFLKNWTYFDLQTKIKYKAEEAGIKVVSVSPKYTSQRCSKCGYISTSNRITQARFHCIACGFEENADYNASQNLSINKIDKIIGANLNQTLPKMKYYSISGVT